MRPKQKGKKNQVKGQVKKKQEVKQKKENKVKKEKENGSESMEEETELA